MRAEDLHNIACMVAQGLRDCSQSTAELSTFQQSYSAGRRTWNKETVSRSRGRKLIEQLKDGTAPRQRKPWELGEPNACLPMNPTTGKRYKASTRSTSWPRAAAMRAG